MNFIDGFVGVLTAKHTGEMVAYASMAFAALVIFIGIADALEGK
jgi:hypothetical protein